MPVYLTPGVYIEEIPSGAKPIEGAATSVAAFVGPAVRGPAGDATLIGSLDDYKATYGDIASEGDATGIAVQSFYLNGGKSAYICRLSGAGAAASSASINGEGAVGGATTANPVLVVSASSVGDWGNDLYMMIEKPDPDAARFDLMIGHQDDGDFVADETFAGLGLVEDTANYVVTVVNGNSSRVTVSLGDDAEIGGPTEQYQDATIVGGHTGTAATYFSAGLGGSTSETLSLNLNGRGTELVTVDLSGATIAGADHDADAGEVRAAVEAAIRDHSTLQVFQDVTVAYAGGRFTVTSPEDGSRASLAIASGTLADLMRLTSDHRTVLTGGQLGSGGTVFSTGFPALASFDLSVTIDGFGPVVATVDPTGVTLGGTNAADGQAVAAAVETAVRNVAPAIPAFKDFTCEYDGTRRFVLTSGAGSPRTSGITVDVGVLATFLMIDSSGTPTVVTGREVNQGVARVMPVETLGLGSEGQRLAGGTSVLPSGSDYAAFYGNVLRKVRDVTMLVLPGQAWTATGPTAAISNSITFAESAQRLMVLIDPPLGYEFADATDVDAISPPTSTYTTMYYPWVATPNPLYDVDTNPTAPKTVLAPPSAFAAGLWTRTDNRRGVWKAPAGVETRLTGAVSLQFDVEDTEQAQLNPLGINCFRKIPTFGPVIWGARTLATKAVPEWRYVPVRRTALFIEQSIRAGIQWAVFEPNGHELWGSLRANIGGFMSGLFRAGAFQGETADQAFFVRCNLGDTMTQADIDRGQVIVVVGFAPLKPAEFVIVRIQQKVGQQ